MHKIANFILLNNKASLKGKYILEIETHKCLLKVLASYFSLHIVLCFVFIFGKKNNIKMIIEFEKRL